MQINAPGEARTPNPRFRRPMLYPVELRAQTQTSNYMPVAYQHQISSRWSPDMTKIAFARITDYVPRVVNLYMLETASKNVQWITFARATDHRPAGRLMEKEDRVSEQPRRQPRDLRPQGSKPAMTPVCHLRDQWLVVGSLIARDQWCQKRPVTRRCNFRVDITDSRRASD